MSKRFLTEIDNINAELDKYERGVAKEPELLRRGFTKLIDSTKTATRIVIFENFEQLFRRVEILICNEDPIYYCRCNLYDLRIKDEFLAGDENGPYWNLSIDREPWVDEYGLPNEELVDSIPYSRDQMEALNSELKQVLEKIYQELDKSLEKGQIDLDFFGRPVEVGKSFGELKSVEVGMLLRVLSVNRILKIDKLTEETRLLSRFFNRDASDVKRYYSRTFASKSEKVHIEKLKEVIGELLNRIDTIPYKVK